MQGPSPRLGADLPRSALPTASIVDVLTLAPDGPRGFRSRHLQSNPGGTVFGGVLIGQLLGAAGQGLDEALAAHHLHLTFLSAGQVDGDAVRYDVSTPRAGRSFTTRQVVGRQGDRAIVSGEVSFHRPELGPAHQAGPLHAAPDPDSLPALHEVARQLQPALGSAAQRLITPGPTELRMVDAEAVLLQRDAAARLRYWVRLGESLPDDPPLHACALGYLSDFWFPLTALLPHLGAKVGHGLHVTSLNHAIWFHRPVRADQWLWVEGESPGTGGARGLSIGRVYDRDGRLVASLAQENLFRGWVSTERGDLVPPRGHRAGVR